jgi:hypothetical protein
MRKALLAITAAGLLLSVPAIAQNSNNNQGQSAPAATTQQGPQTGQSNRSDGRLQNEGGSDRVQSNTRERMGRNDRGEHGSVSVREGSRSRTTVGFHGRDRDFHGRDYRAEAIGFGHRHCRDVVVRSHHHGNVVVRHIHRCFR